ncbi:hypothetical protein [Paeniglutamicibacter sp.]|uniref:hypothetical protein n=1 Tax=Paeniglutamicibacter sp. TaxID=1934391 RepID=UPI003988D56B
MPTPLRNIAAVVLLLAAVLLGTGSLLGSAASTMIDTPEPLQRILGPLATDPELRRVLPDELGAVLGQRLTGDTAIPGQLAGPLQDAIDSAGGALLDGPGFPAAWATTIETARADFTTRLADAADAADVAGAAGGGQVTLRLDLAPLLGSGYDTLQASLDGSALGALLPTTLSLPPAVLDTGWPSAQQLPTETLNAWLSVARAWGWMLAGALVAAAAGLLLATRSGRPWAVLSGGLMALALGGGARLWIGYLGPGTTTAAAPGVESLVTARMLAALEGELAAVATILVTSGIVLLLLGAVWGWWAARDRDVPVRG